MPTRIICIEEHVGDALISQITRPALSLEAPYLADYGTEFQDDPDANPNGLPQCEAPNRAERIQLAPIASRLPEMDAHGINMQVLSYPVSTQYAPLEEAIEAARAANDRLSGAILEHPARFGGFSVLPWQSPDAAIDELDRSSALPGFKGTMLTGLPSVDTFLDDPKFRPVLARLEQLDIPLYLHPGFPMRRVQQAYYSGFGREVSARLSLFGWGFHHEAGLQVVRLILSGTLDRFPNLKIISGHWGEMVPFYLHRLDETLPPKLTGLSRSILQTYRDQVYVTPSGMLNTAHMLFVRDVVGAERIIFSMDYPWITLTGAKAWLESLPMDHAELEAIAHGNAEKLLKL